MTLHRYMRAKKIPIPEMRSLAGVNVRVWTDEDIEAVRQLLPKIANGRKIRHQKGKKQKTKEGPKAKH